MRRKQVQTVLFDIPKKEGLTYSVPDPVPEPVTEVSVSDMHSERPKKGIHSRVLLSFSRSPAVQGLHAVRIPQQARRARTGAGPGPSKIKRTIGRERGGGLRVLER